MQFAFQIILLAVGFGIGYLLLITANKHEAHLKTIGETLGWILIAMAIILAIFSCYYSMKITNRDYMQGGCPVQMQQQGPMMNNGTSGENEDLQRNGTRPMVNQDETEETQEDVSGNKNVPIKRNIQDHE